MEMDILQFFETQAQQIIMAELAVLILLAFIQILKSGRTNRHLRFLAKGVSGYLQVVLETGGAEEDEEESETQPELMSRQEQDMREAIERQQQKKLRDAQVFDAVLSEIFP